MSNKEHDTLVKCAANITDHFAATDLTSVGLRLVGKGLIPVEVAAELDTLGTAQAKANKIFHTLVLSVKADSSKFKQLLELLE